MEIQYVSFPFDRGTYPSLLFAIEVQTQIKSFAFNEEAVNATLSTCQNSGADSPMYTTLVTIGYNQGIR